MKYNILFISVLSGLISSCRYFHNYKNDMYYIRQYEKRVDEPSCTLIIHNSACTECLDGYIDSGYLKVPNDLFGKLRDTISNKDIVLVGKFPFELIDASSFRYDTKIVGFKISGKVIGVDTVRFLGRNSPVFYVETWVPIKSRW